MGLDLSGEHFVPEARAGRSTRPPTRLSTPSSLGDTLAAEAAPAPAPARAAVTTARSRRGLAIAAVGLALVGAAFGVRELILVRDPGTWFWTLVGAAVTGAAVGTAFALRPEDQQPVPGSVGEPSPLQLP